jgi:hypothetical protein
MKNKSAFLRTAILKFPRDHVLKGKNLSSVPSGTDICVKMHKLQALGFAALPLQGFSIVVSWDNRFMAMREAPDPLERPPGNGKKQPLG